LEAGFQGLAGATLGALLGAVIAVISGMLRFGITALVNVPWAEALISVLTASGVGCLLSLLGVLYPAFVAARMQPVEAMRVEQ
jgi:ABC-type antimicrobial peptide transport system permease subunit